MAFCILTLGWTRSGTEACVLVSVLSVHAGGVTYIALLMTSRAKWSDVLLWHNCGLPLHRSRKITMPEHGGASTVCAGPSTHTAVHTRLFNLLMASDVSAHAVFPNIASTFCTNRGPWVIVIVQGGQSLFYITFKKHTQKIRFCIILLDNKASSLWNGGHWLMIY